MDKKIKDLFGVLSDSEVAQCTDLQNALELINKENVITDVEPLEAKKFIVKKNENIDLTQSDLKNKEDVELDEIANQADQAFTDLMDIALNTAGKACGDIASAANNFLNIKLNTRIAKMDAKMKKLNYELNKAKFEATKGDNTNSEDEDDGIVIINN